MGVLRLIVPKNGLTTRSTRPRREAARWLISDKNTLLNMSFMCILMHMIVHIKGAQYENDIEYSG